MTRVATLPMQTVLGRAMTRAQAALADSNLQLETQRKVQDYAALGSATGRVLSASSLLAQQQAQASLAKQVQTTLGFYDTSLNAIDDSVSALKKKLLDAIGTGDSPNLDSAIQNAFVDFRNALNTNQAGVPIFAGSRTDTDPFQLKTLADLAGIDPKDAFANDGVQANARLGDAIDVRFGIGASDIGTGLVEAFQTLAALGPFGDKLTDAQMDGLKTAMGQIDQGLSGVRAVNARNGDMQNQVDALGDRAAAKGKLLESVVGDAVDADMGQVAIDISAREQILSASYGAFSQLNNLSLLNFLR